MLAEFAETHLLLVETRLAVSPKLQLIGSYQRDTDGNASVLNARLAWEFLPLSFVYVVVTDTRAAYRVARRGARRAAGRGQGHLHLAAIERDGP